MDNKTQSLLPAKMRKIHSKMKLLYGFPLYEDDPFKKEVAREVSHCKSMQIFMTLKGS